MLQAARTQLQLATKNNPSLVERYAIYVCSELAKRLKTDSDGLDLLGYVEFQRNYRWGRHAGASRIVTHNNNDNMEQPDVVCEHAYDIGQDQGGEVAPGCR
jgi:hypothetical protein